MISKQKDSSKTETVRGQSLVLKLENMGEVPSFKNAKRIVALNLLATRKDVKQWMNAATACFASQLHSEVRAACGATSTDRQRQSWIASHAPSDDARQIIRELQISTEDVPPGLEGVIVIVEPI